MSYYVAHSACPACLVAGLVRAHAPGEACPTIATQRPFVEILTPAQRAAAQTLATLDAPCVHCVLKSADHASACGAGQCYVRHPRREHVSAGGEPPPQSECW